MRNMNIFFSNIYVIINFNDDYAGDDDDDENCSNNFAQE